MDNHIRTIERMCKQWEDLPLQSVCFQCLSSQHKGITQELVNDLLGELDHRNICCCRYFRLAKGKIVSVNVSLLFLSGTGIPDAIPNSYHNFFHDFSRYSIINSSPQSYLHAERGVALYLLRHMTEDVVAIQIKSKLPPCPQCQSLFDGSSSFIRMGKGEYIFVGEEQTQSLSDLLQDVRLHRTSETLFPFLIAPPNITFEFLYRTYLQRTHTPWTSRINYAKLNEFIDTFKILQFSRHCFEYRSVVLQVVSLMSLSPQLTSKRVICFHPEKKMGMLETQS